LSFPLRLIPLLLDLRRHHVPHSSKYKVNEGQHIKKAYGVTQKHVRLLITQKVLGLLGNNSHSSRMSFVKKMIFLFFFEILFFNYFSIEIGGKFFWA
jgi:hypothetical protein